MKTWLLRHRDALASVASDSVCIMPTAPSGLPRSCHTGSALSAFLPLGPLCTQLSVTSFCPQPHREVTGLYQDHGVLGAARAHLSEHHLNPFKFCLYHIVPTESGELWTLLPSQTEQSPVKATLPWCLS